MKTRRNKRQLALFMLVALFSLSFFGYLPAVEKVEAAVADHIVINEIHIDSVSGSGGTDDDWVELYNSTASAISLDGWSIQKMAGTGSSLYRQALSGTIPAGGYFLVVRDGSTTQLPLLEMADVVASDSFSLASNNIVFLVDDNESISDASDPNIVDFVGFGTAIYYEGTSAAPDVSETKSIARVPDGEDTDENAVDLILQDSPTPQNSGEDTSSDVEGSVLLTAILDDTPVQNITPAGADIVFSVNGSGNAIVDFGLDDSYGNSTLSVPVTENTPTTISLSGLACGTIYHYSVYAENDDATQNDRTLDEEFTTLPCGISIDSLAMTKSSAKANDVYEDGWTWEFNITVWNETETTLKMKFEQWSGLSTLDAGNNMQFSVDDGANWFDITDDDTYPALGADIGSIDESLDAGRQVKVLARMKVPQGTLVGSYTSSYGILTE